MKYKRFEDLPVWQAAMELAKRVFTLTEDKNFNSKGDLRSQLQRACLSVGNNIAEGFERGTTRDLLKFLYIARGSAGEVRSILILMDRLRWFEHLKTEIAGLRLLAENIARQLRGWADSLQNSSIAGQRYLNNQTRAHDEKTQRVAAFWDKLEKDHAQRLESLGNQMQSDDQD